MIDAKTFASSYTAFWRGETPTCDVFVRRMNLGFTERFTLPMDPSASKRPGFIAELAFSLFCIQSQIASGEMERIDKSALSNLAIDQTRTRLAPFQRQGLDIKTPLSKVEKEEVRELYSRLTRFFKIDSPEVTVRPIFEGCGFIDASEGDVIEKDCLFEVKSVERNFRSVDLKQLITYTSLNYLSSTYQIKKVGLFNPRKGIYWKIELDELCSEISGRPAPELLSEICATVSSGDISR